MGPGGPPDWGPPPPGQPLGLFGGFCDAIGSCLNFICCCWLIQDCFGGPPGPFGPPPHVSGPCNACCNNIMGVSAVLIVACWRADPGPYFMGFEAPYQAHVRWAS